MKNFKSLKSLIVILIFSFLFISCGKDDNAPDSNVYPKQVSITYKVTSTTINSAVIIQYRNETGGNTDVPNPALPYTKTFDRTVNNGDVLSLGYGTNTNQTVKLEILVNNTIVKSQEFMSTAGAIIYSFQ